MSLHSIDKARRLYVIKAGYGYSCFGFDNAHAVTAAISAWTGRSDLAPPARKGTRKAYAAYQRALVQGFEHARATRSQCLADLTPALIGLEGCRVEVRAPGEEPRRFWVGRSTGWMPIHIEIARRDSIGGGGAYLSPGSSVVVIRRRGER